ncbi:unnamed protein product [Urochloa decumbens]|uniref:WRKY domain-containing protein n=1 Tax=Urochloa decumbens TaxID=240449 RepID=A0ABC8YKG6_9POAL
MASSSQQPAEIESGGERNEVGEAAAMAASEAGNGNQLVMPEDGYEWKKYGQKFIKNIQKISQSLGKLPNLLFHKLMRESIELNEWCRSYFRCRNKLCGAKKKVEWHPSDPSGALRIVYDGAHQHGSPPPSSSAAGGAASNKYELGAQYFGGPPPQ